MLGVGGGAGGGVGLGLAIALPKRTRQRHQQERDFGAEHRCSESEGPEQSLQRNIVRLVKSIQIVGQTPMDFGDVVAKLEQLLEDARSRDGEDQILLQEQYVETCSEGDRERAYCEERQDLLTMVQCRLA